MKTPSLPRITVVTPVYNEAKNLHRYRDRVVEILMRSQEARFEVLFVDDGSQDAGWEMICQISRDDVRFRGIRLSRNFGSHAALCAGLHSVEADAVATLACDLQDPPETILEFVRGWRSGARIVWGKRRSRQDSWWRVAASGLFEGMLRRFAMPRDSKFATGSFFLIDRRVLRCYRQFRERRRITFALVAYTGFSQATVDYDRVARVAGRSSWSLMSMFRAAYDSFFGFSRIPFGVITVLGVLLFVSSIPFSVYLLLCYAMGHPQPGWTSIMLALTVFFGLQFIYMSFMGEYIARVYTEVVQRPIYFVADDTNESEDASHAAA